MDAPIPTLETLFEQLGLDSTPDAIDAFIVAHPLPEGVKLIDAPFWSAQQASFLKEELRDDAEWAIAVDELNQRLHQSQ
ncbi:MULTISPECIES: DUF2789 domain-containing protein [unclassified Pseudomonas]|uniref:DUF2789 domain-containing protein n=1 Tax=unclassified Pseudomonas TaxID=196821 RepID=UPI000C86B601|nr:MULTISPECIES: DUF2789 domain-containing protein [unclassified Pseudomonas]PMV17618.1 DUF2789 domain-containing protein [Pseudomonas sp. FW305-3-2-15-C-TSA2]PMV22967.1 DUF2789 domain-containing protein [Pseudomonas sp. DP16D-L5]PMV36475.1 DUF2789 domain-containing protein [Pseudomonas sp. FW305-3-2-15-A-LB2]PMV40162.1 DUF2789 domain-containing protein [Pseudomonas sp. FW305-3-2-15-C-R2A1]PMV48540.1 DUF2789 domain-containing protein [Pseudomonas sp. FW305-3-2-15-C-LB1]